MIKTYKLRAMDCAGQDNEYVQLAQAFLEEAEEARREAFHAPWWRWDRRECLLGSWLLRHIALAICRWQKSEEIKRFEQS